VWCKKGIAGEYGRDREFGMKDAEWDDVGWNKIKRQRRIHKKIVDPL